MSRNGLTIEESLNPSILSHRNRLRLFTKLNDYKRVNPSGAALTNTTIKKMLTSCGYELADFTSGLNVNNITKITQIPLKHNMSGTLTINQTDHQSTNLFIIKKKSGSSTLVINTNSVPDSGTGSIVTSTGLANTDTTTFGGDIDISKNNIHVKDISAIDISCSDISATNLYVRGNLIVEGESTFTGRPTAPTATAGTNTTQLATTAFVKTTVDNLVGSAPEALDTLKELAAAIDDDSNYAATVTTALSGKHPSITPSARLNANLIHDGSVDNTEFGYLNGVTSAIQTQLGTKASSADPTFTGTLNVSGDISCNDISANDICANKIYYSNMFVDKDKLPDANTYHGMFAHVHSQESAYYSHYGKWVELADKHSDKSFTAGDISVNNIFLPANTATTKIKITQTGNIDISGNMFAQGQISTTLHDNSTDPRNGSIIARGGVGISGNLVVGGSRGSTNEMVMGISANGIGVGGTFASPSYIIPINYGGAGTVLTSSGEGGMLNWGAGGGGGGSSQWTPVPTESPTRIYYDKQVVIGSTFELDASSEIKLHVTGDAAITKNITAYYSDERLKTFQGKIPNAIKKINQLNGYYFVENELAKSLGYNNDKVQVGVSAQEVEKVLPEIVTQAPIDKKYKTVWYDKLTPLLIEGIKEQQQQIENQQQQIDELKEIVKSIINK